MAALMRASIQNTAEVRRFLERINPGENKRIVRNALVRSALEVQKNAVDLQIAAGGRGKGKALSVLPHKLTSRTGTLRRSIGLDKSDLPFAIEVGTALVYGGVHEHGSRTHPKRPFMAPALAAISPRFGQIVVAEWTKAAGLR